MSPMNRVRTHTVPLNLNAVRPGQRFIVRGIDGEFRLAVPRDLPQAPLSMRVDGRRLILCVGPEEQLFWLALTETVYVYTQS